ncbi:amino acid transporter [Microthyrium microscopicum]|uniref:Amino acid transporter n=1 Tax=Microthyrium microscopicum TaxID=703497 RepID=A0A6A6U232_9PEZI|nr:amino acid transporter [Microthyrium microscopicum]
MSTTPDDVEKSKPDAPTDAFGDEQNAEIQYKTMNWWHLSLLMLAETISLGILSLPWAVSKIGLVPGVILILVFGLLACYTGTVYGQYKLANPQIVSIADAGGILFGRLGPRWARFGHEFFGTAAMLVLVFIMAAHVIGFCLMMDVLAPGKACLIWWAVLGTVIQLILTLPRTMKATSYIAILSSLSVLISVIIVMNDVTRKNKGDKMVEDPINGASGTPFSTAFTAVLNICISYAGHVAYFSFAAELKNPNHFKYALWLQLSIATLLYTVVGGFIYYYVGNNVQAPALGSASPKVKKIAYGIASLTIIVAGVVNGHVFCKYFYVRFFSKSMHSKSWKSWGIWASIVTGAWFVAWLLSELVPSFQHMLALVSALFSAWFTYGASSFFWFDMNRGKVFSSPSKIFMALFNFFIIVLGAILSFTGIYAVAAEMKNGLSGKIFSCTVPGSGDST